MRPTDSGATTDYTLVVTDPTNPDEAGTLDTFGVKPGDVFAAKYEIVSKLGSGGMGAVFLARHREIGKLVAIKILRADLAKDRQHLARFLQEARAANEVTHRNIVEVLDFGSHEGRPYLVMEYLRGESLGEVLARERRMAPAAIIRVFVPLLKALAAAHQRGVIHRDIKPDNLFLSRDDDTEAPTPKILDFGIAKRTFSDDVRLTDTRAAFGTPAYMAPEQAMGARDVTPAADQYAVGVIIYEALSGRLPHEGGTYNALIVAKVTNPPADLGEVCPDLEPALVRVVMRALAREPADRFASVTALREALEPFAGITTAASQPSLRPVAATSVETDATVPDTRSDPTAKATTAGSWSEPTQDGLTQKRSRARILAMGAVVVIATVVGAIRLVRPTPGPRPASSAPAPRPAATVSIDLRLLPEEAEIRLDGEIVGHGVAHVVRPRDGTRHALHVRASGFEDLDEVITADADSRIDRALRPLAVAPVVTAQPAPATPSAIDGHPAPATRPRAQPAPAVPGARGDVRHPRMDRDIHL